MPFDPSIMDSTDQQAPDTGGLPGIDPSQQVASPQIPQSSPQNPPVLQPPSAPNTGGWLKQSLQRFAYFGGQAALKHVGLPTDDELQQHQAQLQLTQAEIDQKKAATAQLGQMVTLPNGVSLPLVVAKTVYPAYFRGQAQQAVAETKEAGANSRLSPAIKLGNDYVKALNDGDEAGAAKILENLRNLTGAIKPPTGGPAGKPNAVVYAALGPSPDPTKDPAGAAEWAAKAEKIMTRMSAAPRIQGYAALAKFRAENTPFQTSDSQGNPITISAADAIKSGAPSLTVWNSVFGPTGSTKSQGQAAGAVAEHIPDFKKSVLALQARGELGPVMGRINDYLTKGYGGDDPDISNFVTTIGLLKSGAVRAHFGARGGSQVLSKFDNLVNTAQTGPALIGSIDAIDSFLNTYKGVGTAQPPKNAGVAPKGGGIPEPTRPANVPPGYTYKAAGPKGPGWYRN